MFFLRGCGFGYSRLVDAAFLFLCLSAGSFPCLLSVLCPRCRLLVSVAFGRPGVWRSSLAGAGPFDVSWYVLPLPLCYLVSFFFTLVCLLCVLACVVFLFLFLGLFSAVFCLVFFFLFFSVRCSFSFFFPLCLLGFLVVFVFRLVVLWLCSFRGCLGSLFRVRVGVRFSVLGVAVVACVPLWFLGVWCSFLSGCVRFGSFTCFLVVGLSGFFFVWF